MRISIVFKLFILTTVLCLFMLAVIYIGQTIFFKQYYENRKINDIQTNIQAFKQNYLNNAGNRADMQKLEQEFYRQNNSWITVLDSQGYLKNVNDFYVEVKFDDSAEHGEFSGTTITVPLYNMVKLDEDLSMTLDELKASLSIDSRVFISSLKVGAALIPYRLWQVENGAYLLENEIIDKKMLESDLKLKFEYTNSRDIIRIPENYLSGRITKLQVPSGNAASGLIYMNSLFMERIKEFQATLVFEGIQNQRLDTLQIYDFKQNDVKYKLLIEPLKDQNGETSYIFSLTSFQPVDEAVRMLKDYYVYIIALVMLLVVLAALYYSRKIARPLLQINKTTKRIASLDFSESIQVRSNDEIGDLALSINSLSQTLHSYIEQLQRDIEKEKQLESTRKEFISGVSHELKTPLSVMKSCISILKDGVANHKREHYFQAMEQEVDRMDLLIVDMLELAKFESGTYKMKMDAFYIDKVIEQICQQLSVQIRHKQLQLHTDLEAIEVMGNQHRIEQVITNFLVNAISYTSEHEHIFISVMNEGCRIKVSIENKGAHIPAEQLDKVWDRFYRGDTARYRAQGGTGLGLAISKNILELHGASYGVTNTEDGVLFYFYLSKT
ncbi:sensor histidine kinase [Paenibacillus sp. EC2-1]|uniref:sensor histidine kinase n=1 Tax=Paenibacillus sp. EC2-1 TaxID=3388665 RepID=UPI003BEEB791